MTSKSGSRLDYVEEKLCCLIDFMIEWYSELSLFVRSCKGQFVADAMRIEFLTLCKG